MASYAPGGLDAAEVRDISAGGAFVRPLCEKPLRPGRIFLAVYTSAGEGPLRLSGDVVWVGYHPTHGCIGAGIRFDVANEDIPRRVSSSEPLLH
jgi:hypothetical protein